MGDEAQERPSIWEALAHATPKLMDVVAVVMGVIAGALFIAGNWWAGLTFTGLAVTWVFLALAERHRRRTLALIDDTQRRLDEWARDQLK